MADENKSTVDMSAWTVAERYVIARMDRIENKVDSTAEKILVIHGEVAGLKVRTGLFASAFGIVGGFLVALLKGHF
ncbi:MAG TPA: hypothetical protein VGN95_16485 [Pyrinomonadaceae bacterium]|nr:hypothetical protein [Pyrinomonadaceae bacterium]